MSGTNQITGGAFQDLEGSVLANGYLTMQLSHDEQFSFSSGGDDPDGQVVGGSTRRIPLDANGNINGTVYVWPNDQLNPANSYYIVNAYRRDGVQAWLSPQYQTVTSSPSPFNVGAWVPNNPPAGGAPVGSILLQNNGINNLSQAIENLKSTDGSVTITDEGSGAINLQAKSSSFSTAGVGGFWSAGFPLQAINGFSVSNGPIVCTVAGSQVIVWQFVLESSWTISNVSCYVSSGVGGASVNFGFYSATGNLLLDSGALSAATTNTIQSTTVTPTVLPSGSYYFAAACTSDIAAFIAFSLNSIPLLNVCNGVGTLKIAYAANLLSAGALPATLGTLTSTATNACNMPAAFFGV